MFDKYGEMNHEEINKAAAGFLAEGDLDSIKGLAFENGLDPDDAEDFIRGDVHELTNARLAAYGRLRIETEEEEDGPIAVIRQMTQAMIADDLSFAEKVTRKGKRLKDVYKRMEEEARKKKKGGSACICGTDRDLQKRIRDYYEEIEG